MPELIRAELHSHSTYSDGAYEPTQLAKMCAERGVQTWALSDHDTCEGCAEAATAAAEHGIEFITGIEVSAYIDRSIHVLGYGVDPASPVLLDYSKQRLQARQDRMALMIERLRDLGVDIDVERVQRIAGKGSIGRPHLARALVEVGAVESMQDAFDNWISNNGKVYVATTWPKVPDAIDIINAAGGIAVLAHPGIYDRDEHIGDWVDAGIVGIEVRHPKHSAEDEARYTDLARRFGLLTTGSSDFHGPGHISADYFGKVELDATWLDALRERLQR